VECLDMKRVHWKQLTETWPALTEEALNNKRYCQYTGTKSCGRASDDARRQHVSLDMMRQIVPIMDGETALELARRTIGVYDVNSELMKGADKPWKSKTPGEQNATRKLAFFKEQSMIRAHATLDKIPDQFWEKP